MELYIDKNSGVPLYIQLKKQIMKSITDGTMKVGSKVPTEREMAEKLKVSRNTVSTAYSELEQEGVLKSYQGRGTFVVEESEPWKVRNIKQKIIKFVDLSLEEAFETGMSTEEFIEIVTQRVSEKKELMSKITAAYVECNIEQSRMFSKQLTQSTNMHVIPITIPDLESMKKETKESIEKCQVVIATFNHVNEVNRLVKPFNKEVLGVAINPDLETIVKIARYPVGTRFCFMCISEEFMFKIKDALETSGLGEIDIEYSNSKSQSEIQRIIDNSDVILVSPGRYNDVNKLNKNSKPIIKFLYSLDDGSVKALKSRIIEIKYQK